MGHAIPKQHPAVVLRSHYNLVRALLGVAMVALVGLVIALVIVANDDEPASTGAVQAVPAAPPLDRALPAYPTPAPEAVSPGSDRSYSGPAPTRKLDGSTDVGRTTAPVTPGTRYDGGPEEGTRGAIQSPPAPGTRYDGGPEEGTRGGITSSVAPGNGAPDESKSGPGFRTD